MTVRWTVLVLVGLTTAMCSLVLAGEPVPDQVLVTVLRDRVIAATPGEGLLVANLRAGEQVQRVESKGLNAYVQTPVRLLGFSSKVRRWQEQRIDLREQVQTVRVEARLILVHTEKRLYGFRGPVGRWQQQDLETREQVQNVLSDDNLAVVVTDRRLLGFSAFHGGFFEQDRRQNEPIIDTTSNDNVVILSTASRRWIFRSRVPAWTELR